MIIHGNSLEELKKLEGLETYGISKDGQVINLKTGNPLKFNKDHKGYLKARLWCPAISQHKDKRKPFRLHRLVAEAYLDTWNKELQVNHKDGNKLNNHISNLEMVTCSENVYHAWNSLNSSERKKKLIENNRKRKK